MEKKVVIELSIEDAKLVSQWIPGVLDSVRDEVFRAIRAYEGGLTNEMKVAADFVNDDTVYKKVDETIKYLSKNYVISLVKYDVIITDETLRDPEIRDKVEEIWYRV